MATAAQAPATPTTTDPVQRWLERRAATNRANSQHSTGPRTEPGKQRSSQNALRHGLTARTAVLPTEDPEAYQRHIQQFLDEYQPATATETQLVHELANTSWRLNRIPFLEADLFPAPPTRPPTKPQSPSTSSTLIAPSPRSACMARASPASSKMPSSSSAISRRSATAWSAVTSPKRPKSSCAITAKDFPGSLPTIFQNRMASFFQKSRSSATHDT